MTDIKATSLVRAVSAPGSVGSDGKKRDPSVFPPPAIDFLSIFIVPFGFMLSATLNHLGFPYLFIAFVVYFLYRLHRIRRRLTFGWLVRSALSLVVRLFFREIGSSGANRIPRTGPVIFVCAPHANQFLDPLVVVECSSRPIGFLSAAASMRRQFVGLMARAMGAIGVERPQDLAKPMNGKVTLKGSTVVGSDGTEFKSKLEVGGSISIKGEIYVIAAIKSDTELTIKEAVAADKEVSTPSSIKLVPKVDQAAVFDNVFNALGAGQCIGIFPEGGSHDRTDFLPLKAGVTIMALGAMAKYPGLDVKIVPVGLNYFNGHRFRSRAYVDIGAPMTINPQHLLDYKAGGEKKRNACGTLLTEIHTALKTVTVTAPNHEVLHTLWAIRSLYVPSGVKLKAEQKLELTRRFELAYEQLGSDPRVKALEARVRNYDELVQSFGLKHHQVRRAKMPRSAALVRLIYRTAILIIYAFMALPGLLLNAPVIIMARTISKRKAQEALASSTVKIAANDVLATWKVLVALALVPLCFVIYPILAALLGYFKGWGALRTWAYFALLQPIAMYGSVRFVEIGLALFTSLRPLFLAVTAPSVNGSNNLQDTRISLKQEIRALVEALAPMFLQGKERLIKSSQFRRAVDGSLIANSPVTSAPPSPSLTATPAASTPPLSPLVAAVVTPSSSSSEAARRGSAGSPAIGDAPSPVAPVTPAATSTAAAPVVPVEVAPPPAAAATAAAAVAVAAPVVTTYTSANIEVVTPKAMADAVPSTPAPAPVAAPALPTAAVTPISSNSGSDNGSSHEGDYVHVSADSSAPSSPFLPVKSITSSSSSSSGGAGASSHATAAHVVTDEDHATVTTPTTPLTPTHGAHDDDDHAHANVADQEHEPSGEAVPEEDHSDSHHAAAATE